MVTAVSVNFQSDIRTAHLARQNSFTYHPSFLVSRPSTPYSFFHFLLAAMKTVAAALLAVGSVSALPALNSTAFAFTNGSLADAASNKTVTVTTPVTVTTVVEAMQTVDTTLAAVARPSTQVIDDGTVAPAPTVTLTPAVHWDIVVGPEQLVPATAPSALYYDNGGAEGKTSGMMCLCNIY